MPEKILYGVKSISVLSTLCLLPTAADKTNWASATSLGQPQGGIKFNPKYKNDEIKSDYSSIAIQTITITEGIDLSMDLISFDMTNLKKIMGGTTDIAAVASKNGAGFSVSDKPTLSECSVKIVIGDANGGKDFWLIIPRAKFTGEVSLDVADALGKLPCKFNVLKPATGDVYAIVEAD